jgi:hypothetical protein
VDEEGGSLLFSMSQKVPSLWSSSCYLPLAQVVKHAVLCMFILLSPSGVSVYFLIIANVTAIAFDLCFIVSVEASFLHSQGISLRLF